MCITYYGNKTNPFLDKPNYPPIAHILQVCANFCLQIEKPEKSTFSALGFDLKKLKLRVNQTRSSFPMGTALDGSKISRCWTNGNDDKVTKIMA